MGLHITKGRLYALLRFTERYTRTDMVYLAKGGFWFTLGQVFATLASLISVIAFANFVDPSVYGSYRYVLSIAALLAIPTMAGSTAAVIRAVAKGLEGAYTACLKDRLYGGVLGAVAGLGFALYTFSNGNIELAVAILLASLFVPVMEAYALYDSVLQGKRDFRRSSVFSVWSQIFAVSTTLVVLYVYPDLIALVLSYFGAWTLARIIASIVTLRRHPLNDVTDPVAIPYARHLTVMGILPTLSNYLDRLLLFSISGPIAVAQYSISLAATEQIKGFFKTFGSLALPSYSNRSYREAVTGVAHKSMLLFAITIVIAILYCIFAETLFAFVFPAYTDAVIYSQLFALSIPTAVGFLPNAIFQANAMTRQLYILTTAGAIGQILFLLAGAFYAGIFGIILARIVMRYLLLIGTYIMLFQAAPPKHGQA